MKIKIIICLFLSVSRVAYGSVEVKIHFIAFIIHKLSLKRQEKYLKSSIEARSYNSGKAISIIYS